MPVGRRVTERRWWWWWSCCADVIAEGGTVRSELFHDMFYESIFEGHGACRDFLFSCCCSSVVVGVVVDCCLLFVVHC